MKQLWLCLFLAVVCGAQQRSGPPMITSPEVHSDRRVTFRVLAPKAADVSFFGDWMKTGTQEKMTKDADGVWSVTLGPLPPSIYIYHFNVDGMTIADPVNPRMKLRARTSASLVEVPGDGSELWQPQEVPHGTVEINWQKSKVIDGETRWIWVYTPPEMKKDPRRRYPVLYLFHGSNDIAGGWTLAGNANFILDNLIAKKQAVPMIVVMPFGHAIPFGVNRQGPGSNNAVFEDYLLKDVIPTIEAKYPILPGRQNRAIAGLSMGGGQALQIGFGHPELFSAIGAFSAAVPNDFETQFAALLSDPKGTNEKFKTVWFACGKDDFLYDRSVKLSQLLNQKQIKHTFESTEGNHTYTVWRRYLGEFAPLLFK